MTNLDGKKLFGNTILSFSVSLILCTFAGVMVVSGKINTEKLIMENLITEKSSRVSETLLGFMHKTQAVSVIALRNYEQDVFEEAAALIVDDPSILNILVAPNGIVTHVYPVKGNEAVIGLNFFSEGAGNREAIQAKETGELVIGGPFNAVQGGQVIVGRLPIFIPEADGSGRFWGLVSVTLKYPQVMDGARLQEINSQGFDYEIWRINPDSGERQIIISSYLTGKNNMPFIEKQLIIKNAEWNYRLYFRRSWYEYSETWLFVFITLCVSFLLAAVIQKKSKDIFEAEERIKLMLDTSPLSCQIMNTNFNTIDCNEAAVKLYGYASKQECIIKWDKECLPEYQPNGRLTREYIWDLFLKAIKEKNNTFEIMHQSTDGVPMPAEITLVKVNFKGEDVIIGYTKDLRDIKNLENKAKEIYFDGLTKIYNRRYFDETFERIIKSSSRSGDILTLMLLDIDFFKKYNDVYGHIEGDNCLRIITAALSGAMSREGDFVARYGGEEFAVVLPNTDEIGARAVANKLLECVRKLHIPHEKSDASNCVTISIGFTTINLQYEINAVDCIRIADKALYMSKQNGRNQYTYIKFEDAEIYKENTEIQINVA